MHPTAYQSYGERSESPTLTPLATYLLRLIHLKRTNLCVSADVTTSHELLRLAEDVGDHICILKTHADIVSDFNDKTIRGLNELARRKKFLVFEDRKFGDIGNTVQQQYAAGPLSIVRWAPIVNAHIFPGPSIITALAEAAKKAITAYNTSVSTDISASPAPSAVGSRNSGGTETNSDDSDSDSDSNEEEDDGPAPRDQRNGSATLEPSSPTDSDRNGRKRSVVSVSTTISTKTEAISPQPTTLRPSLSRHSTSDSQNPPSSETSETSASLATALENLGPPPFFRALLLLAQMSSADNFFSPEYTRACVHHARRNRDFVMGFIAQESLNKEEGDCFITMTPGVQKAATGDGKGQQYNTPRKVVVEGGADVIIVGRGVLNASDRRKEAAEYRRQGWEAYEERLRGRGKR